MKVNPNYQELNLRKYSFHKYVIITLVDGTKLKGWYGFQNVEDDNGDYDELEFFTKEVIIDNSKIPFYGDKYFSNDLTPPIRAEHVVSIEIL